MTQAPESSPLRYAMPEPLLQAIVDHLNGQPAGQVRHLLNAIEAECLRQDAACTATSP